MFRCGISDPFGITENKYDDAIAVFKRMFLFGMDSQLTPQQTESFFAIGIFVGNHEA